MSSVLRRLCGALKPLSHCLATAASLTAVAAESPESTPGSSQQTHYPLNSQPSFTGPENLFIGQVDVQILFPDNPQTAFSGAYVTFQPGARTAWHSHPAGQHMVVTDGRALTGTRDGRVLAFEEGETVWCPQDIDHWHGATPDRAMTHLVITGDKNGENVTWKEHVSDSIYQKAVANTEPEAPELTGLRQQQAALVPVAAFIASGELPALRSAVKVALERGVTISELKETVLHLYAYLGFPRALNAMAQVMAVVDERAEAGKKDPSGEPGKTLPVGTDTEALGKDVQTMLAGSPVDGPLFRFAPAANTYLQRHLFGDLFARGVLDAADREILTVSALANLEGTEPQLKAHIPMSANAGVTASQLSDIEALLKTYVSGRSATTLKDALQQTSAATNNQSQTAKE